MWWRDYQFGPILNRYVEEFSFAVLPEAIGRANVQVQANPQIHRRRNARRIDDSPQSISYHGDFRLSLLSGTPAINESGARRLICKRGADFPESAGDDSAPGIQQQDARDAQKILDQQLQSGSEAQDSNPKPTVNVSLGRDEVLIRADHQTWNQDTWTGTGHVVLRFRNNTLHCDEATYDSTTGIVTATWTCRIRRRPAQRARNRQPWYVRRQPRHRHFLRR